MVRRTRRHILRWWGTTGDTRVPMIRLDEEQAAPYLRGEKPCFIRVGDRENRFPVRRLRTLRYSIEDAYEGFYETIRRKIGDAEPLAGEALTYARYDLRAYLREEVRGEERFAGLRRVGPSLRGLIRVLLFKRLESSVAAFRATLGRLLERQRLFAQALEQGLLPTGEDADALLGKAGAEDDADLLDRLGDLRHEHDPGDFEVARLLSDIRGDIAVFEGLVRLVEPIGVELDAKAQKLREALAAPDLAGRKALIFTQFTDTAEYLGRVLDPEDELADVVVTSGATKNKAAVVGRFAPGANPEFAPAEGEPETRLLVATDAFSEGLNMQDCDVVINYDLHWNPVRLIQRLGRIDRIGSEHKEIQAINFLPEKGIEQNLGILAILRDRIAEIHATIGEDARILDDAEQLNEESMFAIYAEDASALDEPEEEGALLGLQEAEELLRKLQREEPEEYERIAGLRDGIRSARPADHPGTFTLCGAGDFLQARITGPTGEVVTGDLDRVLSLIAADRSEPAPASMPEPHGLRVRAALGAFTARVGERLTRQDHVASLSVGQRYALDQLDGWLGEEADPGRVALLEMLKAAFAQSPTPAVRKQLQRLRRNRVEGRPLLSALQDLYAQHRLRDRGEQDPEREALAVPRVLCSEALG